MPDGTASPSHITASDSDWTNGEIENLVQARFGKRPCWYQLKVAKAFYHGRDVIGCAPTGAGKTLSFWIPLLMAQARGHKKLLFVISPLNVLAKQNVKTLVCVGISAVAVAAENATTATFKVSKFEFNSTILTLKLAGHETRQIRNCGHKPGNSHDQPRAPGTLEHPFLHTSTPGVYIQ
jgi:superfamily II DNA or RNA helicase